MKGDPILAEVDGEAMMIDVEKGMSYFLNETALLIFKMLNQGKDIDDIKQTLMKEYDVDEKEAEGDIREFIDRLDKKGILWGRRNT
ncbi:MAG: HPr-rel-A system PqqD family peptide chaperone [Deltaproteobacteria bacterium]|nr:HPr-rel-A system PqqD family peptide chaperone [Deltaproteobacteria bacterium]